MPHKIVSPPGHGSRGAFIVGRAFLFRFSLGNPLNRSDGELIRAVAAGSRTLTRRVKLTSECAQMVTDALDGGKDEDVYAHRPLDFRIFPETVLYRPEPNAHSITR